MSLRRRTFPEVLDSLLTTITRGIAAEAHPFPPPGATSPPFRHRLLQQPVADVVSIYGSRDGRSHLFRKDVDYKLLPDRSRIEWQTGAELPDAGTLLQVNYYPSGVQPVVNDLHTGSVVRTLAESFALEVARLYAQLEAVYQSAFVDTATGSSLDNVVALLGIERVSGGRAAGEVEFARAPGTPGLITIPAGTRVTTIDGSVEYETTANATLAEGQMTVRVVARDLELNDPLPAGALTLLPVLIAGIAAVTNPAPTAITTQAETDAELRIRAKNFLHGSERATLGALKQAIARQGLTADVEEQAGTPGRLRITPHAETLPPDQAQRLVQAIESARPAGVVVDVGLPQVPARIDLDLRLRTAGGLLEQDLRAAQREVRAKIEDYFARLPVREAGSINRIVGMVLSVPVVEDVRILSASARQNGTTRDVLDLAAGELDIDGVPTVLGELRIADPGLPTQLSVIVTFPQSAAPADRPAIETALNSALSYLNTLNATELPAGASAAELAKRSLTYGKLLYAIPLPGKAAATLESFDNATGTPPTLPDETTVAPYSVEFVFTQQSGLSRTLARATDQAYTLTPFERLALVGVEVVEEADASV